MTTTALPAVEFGHVEPASVHFDDLDAMGMMHNARYALLVERAMAGYWAARGFSFENGRPTSADVFQAVREFTISFLAPIRGTGEVGVHFWLERMGQTGATYGFRFVSPDRQTVYAEGRRSIVRIDPSTMRPTAWSDAARETAAVLLRERP